MRLNDLFESIADQRQRGYFRLLEAVGSEPILQIVAIVRDVVRDRGDLSLCTPVRIQTQVHVRVQFADRIRGVSENWSVVLDYAFQSFPRKIQSFEVNVALLEPCDDPDGLGIVLEAAVGFHQAFKLVLAGMSERRMAKVVRQGDRFRQMRIQRQVFRQRPCDPRHFDRMRQAGSEMIPERRDEHLRLVHQPTECGGMDYSVAIALVDGSARVYRLHVPAPPRSAGSTRIFRKPRPRSAKLPIHSPYALASIDSHQYIADVNRGKGDMEALAELKIPPSVSDRAFERLAEINADSRSKKCLRVEVKGGGCSGFQYEIGLDDAGDDDLILEQDGQSVLIDPVSLPFLENATIDFAEELIGSRFVVRNPNAKSTCGCMLSFSI